VRSKTVVMILLAVVFGAMAIFAGQRYLDRQSSRFREVQLVPKPAPTQTIVVAALPLKFGVEVTRQHLREIAWPEGSVPRGAFAKIDELLDGKTRRVALAALEENEPVLKAKVTGPGQRGSLAAVIQQGMKAVTVRVNDINGVAGFVLPGERVDVLLVRNLERTEAYSDVLLQNVKVLAVDQLADESSDKPALVKAVTVEVTTADAQKLTLAGSVGTLALALRSAGVAERENARRIGVEDLSRPPEAVQLPAILASAPVEEGPRSRMVGVSRGMKRQEYSVPVYGGPARAETHTASTVPPKS
jgi:pilus assembly protein CpaB